MESPWEDEEYPPAEDCEVGGARPPGPTGATPQGGGSKGKLGEECFEVCQVLLEDGVEVG